MKRNLSLWCWLAACLPPAGGVARAQESRPASQAAARLPTSRPAVAAAAGADWPALRNGMKWRCLQVEGSRHVGMFLWFRIGGDHDPEGRTGMAHLMEHLLATSATAATPVRTYEQLAKTRDLGVSAVTRNPCTLVWSIRPLAEAEEDLAWFAAILSSVRIGEADLARERLTMLSEVERMTGHVPGGILQWRGRAALFPGEARGRTVIGVPEEVAAISLAEVLERRRLYTPRNALLLLVGGLAEAEARPMVERLFGGLDGGGEGPPAPPATVAFPAPPRSEEYERVGGPFVSAALAAPPVDHADSPAFLVAAGVLWSRATSTFLQEDRDGATTFRGRGREAEASFPPVLYPFLESPDALLVNCRGGNRGTEEQPRREIEAWLADLAARPPDAVSLRMARAQFETQARPWPASPRIRSHVLLQPRMLYTIGSAVGMHEFLRVPADYGKRFDAVTESDVTRVAKEWLSPNAAKWVALLPKPKN